MLASYMLTISLHCTIAYMCVYAHVSSQKTFLYGLYTAPFSINFYVRSFKTGALLISMLLLHHVSQYLALLPTLLVSRTTVPAGRCKRCACTFLDFAFQLFCRTIFMHRVWHRDWRCTFQSLFYRAKYDSTCWISTSIYSI